ncbi:hypothetical protein HJG60_009399 [Phyllostomus discolor]|uniref:Uncharacterized protein n=1 Tax=Phyllostomus discolor TaxID=89673 RepID=A0A834DDI7_9CHIR|nr:hypothetical protein HJG60_009399 [Phyllostomus discolor]
MALQDNIVQPPGSARRLIPCARREFPSRKNWAGDEDERAQLHLHQDPLAAPQRTTVEGPDDAGEKETVHYFQRFGLDSVSDRCQGGGGEGAEHTVFASEQKVNMKLKKKGGTIPSWCGSVG